MPMLRNMKATSISNFLSWILITTVLKNRQFAAGKLKVTMKDVPKLKTNETNVENFLMQIMSIDSTTGREETLSMALTRYFKATGWNVLQQTLKSDPSRHNLLITHVPYVPPGPRYIMNTHMDTVPPFVPPTRDGDIIRGRGSNDAKGQLAAMVFAAKKIAEEDKKLAENLGILLVVSEELDHIGMVEANDLEMVPEYFMVGEPTELKFGRIQKGALKVVLRSHGKAAHSGYPAMGESAIHKLLDVLHDVRGHKWPSDDILGETTVNIGLISGGQALNALAENASASIFFRVTTSTNDILNQLKNVVAGRAEIDELFGRNEPIRLSDPPQPYDSHVVAFNTDLPYFIARDKLKRAYLFGAGSITNAHSLQEHISISDLKKAVEIHVDIFKNAIGTI